MSSHLWKVTAKKAVGKVAKGMEAGSSEKQELLPNRLLKR